MTETLENNNATPAVIQQLNLAYDADQDRLLLKVGLTDNSELAIWLTRRIAKSIWTWLHGTHVTEESALQVFTMNAQGGLDLFANQSSGVLTSAVWGDGVVDNPAGQTISKGDTVRFISFAEWLA